LTFGNDALRKIHLSVFLKFIVEETGVNKDKFDIKTCFDAADRWSPFIYLSQGLRD
jgi:hypothetical protein